MIAPERILALARMIASDHHPRWRDTAESAAAEHLWRAALRWNGEGSCEAWACSVARLRARRAVTDEIARTRRLEALPEHHDPVGARRDDPEAAAVAADGVRALVAAGLGRVAGRRLRGATFYEAGEVMGVSGVTARLRLLRAAA